MFYGTQFPFICENEIGFVKLQNRACFMKGSFSLFYFCRKAFRLMELQKKKGGSEKNEQQTEKAFSRKEKRKNETANFEKGETEINKISVANGIPSSRIAKEKQRARCLI